MTYPENLAGTKVCVTVTKAGMTVYGNREAFKSLAKWMTWLAESDPSEHYECHLNWHLADDQQERENVWTLFDKLMSEKMTFHQEEAKQFELSFMVLEEHDLQQLELRKSTCLVPDDWENTESTDVHDV